MSLIDNLTLMEAVDLAESARLGVDRMEGRYRLCFNS
jgi:hypothetical protein